MPTHRTDHHPGLVPEIFRVMADTSVTGTAVWSDEIGLDGPPRLLSWAWIVDESHEGLSFHWLFDTTDDDRAAVALAALYAAVTSRLELGIGSVWITANAAVNATRFNYTFDGDALSVHPHIE